MEKFTKSELEDLSWVYSEAGYEKVIYYLRELTTKYNIKDPEVEELYNLFNTLDTRMDKIRIKYNVEDF